MARMREDDSGRKTPEATVYLRAQLEFGYLDALESLDDLDFGI
jgi:hypothetical protein